MIAMADSTVMQTIGKYAIAIGLVLAGAGLAASMAPLFEPTTLLLASILIAAWYGGLGPGLVAAVTALAADEYLFTEPLYSLTPRLAQVPHLAGFAALAALSAWASAARKTAENSLRQARDELDRRVVERTAELTRSNERLAMQVGVARVLADATSLEAAMPKVLQVIGESAG
jgi:K+-sensing histidine kinase KdpD